MSGREEVVVAVGPLDCVSIETTGKKNYFAGNCETFQHAKVKWPQIFLLHRQDHKKMLMGSKNE